MKLWLFGHSLCLPFGLENEPGWGDLLAQDLGAELINLARPGVDNFYIYYCYQQALTHIAPEDYVVIGWSHYSRKSFVLDRSNKNQIDLLDSSLLYHSNGIEFIRSKNPINGDSNKWLLMKPVSRGIDYYDNWFKDYYSEIEQKYNFQSYIDSVFHTCPGNYIPFFFSKESTTEIDITHKHAGFITEFIIENKVQISKDDIHLNETGHKMWANRLQSFVDECILTDMSSTT